MLIMNRISKLEVAIKVIDKTVLDDYSKKHLSRETGRPCEIV